MSLDDLVVELPRGTTADADAGDDEVRAREGGAPIHGARDADLLFRSARGHHPLGEVGGDVEVAGVDVHEPDLPSAEIVSTDQVGEQASREDGRPGADEDEDAKVAGHDSYPDQRTVTRLRSSPMPSTPHTTTSPSRR